MQFPIYLALSWNRVFSTTPALMRTLNICGIAVVLCLMGQASARASGPMVTDLAPTSGMIGAQVLLVGSGFFDANSVSFNGTMTTFVVITDQYIIADVPSGATTGPITVTSPEGMSASATFTVLPSVTIASFSPLQGSVGTPVTITGTNLSGATSVTFNGTPATIGMDTQTQITTNVPSGATTGQISVTTPMGTATSQMSFTVLPSLSITSFAPMSALPGKQVAITGRGFTAVTGVTINGTAAPFQVLSDSYLVITVPAGATTGPLVVSTATGHVSAGTFTVIPPLPTITSFSPTTGPESTSVVLTGTGFTYVSAVTFNGASATFVINSDTQITATVPTGATDGAITVTSPGGTATSATAFVLSAPTVATAAAATTNPVTGTSTALSVLGAYTGGESNLTYTWSATGPASVSFSVNGTNRSKQTTGTFTASGRYILTATIASPSGKTVTSSVMVVVAQTPQAVSVTPNTQILSIGATQSFAASATDQFSSPISGLAYTWAVTGVGNVNSSGLYSSGAMPGAASVTATVGTIVGSASVTVNDVAPTIGAITVNPSPVTGISAMLTVTGSYTGGGTLIYAWSTTAAPPGGSVLFTGGASGMAGSAVTAQGTFSKAGAYTIRVTVTDPNSGTASQTVNVTVVQTGTSVAVTPSSASIAALGTQQFTAQEMDQFGFPMVSQPSFAWQVSSGGGTVNSSGSYTAPNTVGTAAVSATPSDGVAAGTASLTVTNSPPTIVNAAAANGVTGSVTVMGTSVALSVLGNAAGGESTLSYTWTASHSANVTFSDNGDNAAKTVTATFNQAGTETFTVTITDASGARVTSSVAVTVNQALTAITVSPANGTMAINASGTKFTAACSDQFGNPLGTPPSLTWSVLGVGRIDATGNYTVGSMPGLATVTAASGSVSGSAQVTVTDIAPTLSSISVNPSPVKGTTGTLSVIGTYNGGGNLAYAWSAPATPPGGFVTFSGGTSAAPGSAVTTSATFSQPGTYTIQAIVSDAAGTTALKTVSVMVIPAPTISSFSPAGGPVGTSVTITGTNLTGATSVTFNGLAATGIAVISPTQVMATVPAGATPGVISVTTPGGTATTSIGFTVFPAPAITSFSPAIGQIGALVTITGTNMTGTVAVTFNGTPAVTFTVNSSISVTATVPPGATTGAITVTALGGTVTSAQDFTVVPAPTINNFSPSSGPVGSSVTITGTNFANVSGVTFGQATTSAFTINSLNSLTAIVPPGATTSVIGVTTPGGSATSGGVFTVIPSPAITAVSPGTGPVGASVTINGSNFANIVSVTFGGVAATTYTVVSPTQILATVPTGAASGLVSVTTTGGTANSLSSFTVIPAPAISGFTPGSGPVGTTVTITGTNLTGTTSVAFGGISSASYAVISASQITATVPARAVSGVLTVTTPGGMATSAGSFTVVPPPSIMSLAPASGVSGSLVTITGIGFTGTTSIAIGGVPVTTFTIASDITLTAVVPGGAVTGIVTVTTPGGTAISPAFFTIIAPPAITGFSPASGVVGTAVTITGSGFTGAMNVSFGGIAATTFAVNSNTSLTAIVPMAAVTGPVSVMTPGGTANSPNPFTILPAPTISGFTPGSGPIGATVTITGTNLTGATTVAFAGTPAVSYTVVSATQIAAAVPAGASSGVLTVTTPGGTATSAGSFTVIPSPVITTFVPTSGVVGSLVTITGTGFTGATGISFGGVSAVTFSVTSSTTLTALVPSGAVSGILTVSTPGGVAISSSPFTLILPPTLTSFSPASGIVGAAVTITGTNLTGAASVTFGGTPALTFAVASATQITATVPVGAVSGVLTVTTPGGTASSAASFIVVPPPPVIQSFTPGTGIIGALVTVTGTALTGATSITFGGVHAMTFTVTSSTSMTAIVPAGAVTGVVTVTTPGGVAISPAPFTVVPPPTITGFSPASGVVGTAVTITGTNLTGATGVSFGGTMATTFTVNTSTSISVIVPGGAVSGFVSVVTPVATATSAASFTVIAQPIITSVNPSGAAIGDTVTIIGTGLSGVTSVKFSGVSAPVVSDTASQLTVTVPVGATSGTIAVTTPGGTATTTTVFTILTWTAAAMTADPDGTAKVLADRSDSAATVWLFSTTNAMTASTAVFGPFVDSQGIWTAKAVRSAPDGSSRLLWTRADGAMGLWTLTAGGTLSTIGTTYGPYSDASGFWTASGLAVATDGSSRVLWRRSDGAAVVWSMNPADQQASVGPVYGPYGSGQSAWMATGIAGGSIGTSHLLWTRADGAAGLWTLSTANAQTTVGPIYGPYVTTQGTWRAVSVGSSADGVSHVLWTRSDGAAGVWAFSATGVQTDAGPIYGPYPNFGAVDLDTYSDQSRVLWMRSDRAIGIWTYGANDTESLIGTVYGPF